MERFQLIGMRSTVGEIKFGLIRLTSSMDPRKVPRVPQGWEVLL